MRNLPAHSVALAGRCTRQRGSALLIVLVFASIVAILLFMQMPVLIFEAQRNKEQLLVDRGNEYKQAIRLYYRKFQHYPQSFDALENTNRVRFLRKRFKDPFTDKDDWRLIHAGPNGMPIDSKLNLLKTAAGGQATASGGGNSPLGTFNNGQNQPGNQSPFGGSNTFGNSGFGSSGNNSSSGFGGFNSSNRAPQPVNSAGSSAVAPPGMENGIASNADGVDPNVVPAAPSQARDINGQLPVGGENGGIPQAMTPSGVPQPVIRRSAVPNGTNGSATGAAELNSTVQGGGFATSQGGISQSNADGTNPNAAVSSLLANPNPQVPQTAGAAGFNPSTTSGFNTSAGAGGGSTFGVSSPNSNSPFGSSSNNGSSGFGVIQSGALAGVASKAERHSIKLIDEQQQYSLWEFYYNPNKDPLRNGAAALNQIGAGNGGSSAQFGNTGLGALPGPSQNGAANSSPFTNGPSPFGGGNSSGFGGNNSPSGFGSSSNNGGPTSSSPGFSATPQTPTTPSNAPPQQP